jgi:hypothetical protein
MPPPSVPTEIEQLRLDLTALAARVATLEAAMPQIDNLLRRLPLWIGDPPQPPEA